MGVSEQSTYDSAMYFYTVRTSVQHIHVSNEMTGASQHSTGTRSQATPRSVVCYLSTLLATYLPYGPNQQS